ncbi:DNA-3-methyladenine glycosylase family protein [Neobacillus sp. SAB-20_R2A]|uniref:DNA-3-methyladenine glycosylase family protein n=1 Tax=Neobacillus sp. SAB-20_R2A TaxID=3120519 RepID=UPI003C6DD2FD
MHNNNNVLLISKRDSMVTELCNHDLYLGKLINITGDIEIKLRKDYFIALVKSIISQQLSPKAANTIFARFELLLQKDINPLSLQTIDDEQLRNVGVSRQKIAYLRDLSAKFSNGEVNLEKIDEVHNEQIIKTLTNIKGIGKWTAEMFLIFSLGRMDVLPLDDVGLQRAVRWLYSLSKDKDLKLAFQEKSYNWGGNTTIACLYLWEAVNRDFIIKYENIDSLYSYIK